MLACTVTRRRQSIERQPLLLDTPKTNPLACGYQSISLLFSRHHNGYCWKYRGSMQTQPTLIPTVHGYGTGLLKSLVVV